MPEKMTGSGLATLVGVFEAYDRDETLLLLVCIALEAVRRGIDLLIVVTKLAEDCRAHVGRPKVKHQHLPGQRRFHGLFRRK